MRTNIVIDDSLMAAAMAAGGFKTKRDAVEEGLRLIARRAAYQEIRQWRGKLHWSGDDTADWSADVPNANVQSIVQEAAVGYSGLTK